MSWKASSNRDGAKMALTMMKAHYDDADIDMVISGMPAIDEEGNKVKNDDI